jgi:non-homologous end joining protein Ku
MAVSAFDRLDDHQLWACVDSCRIFSATESKSAVSFNMLHKDCGARVRQQLYCPAHQAVIERSDTVKGYEFEMPYQPCLIR